MKHGSANILFSTATICLLTTTGASAADKVYYERDADGDYHPVDLVMSAPSSVSAAQDSNEGDASDDQSMPATSSGKSKSLFKSLMNKAYFWRLRYYFVAQNASNCDLFYGLVQDDPLIGRASVNFTFPSGCNCHGYALVTHYPLSGAVAGQQGYIKAKCSDGRSINGSFTTASLTTGYGTASDTSGNQYQFSFGHTIDQAIQRVNSLRRTLHCQECDAKAIELEIQGKIVAPAK